jgi:hypothetical protein
LAAKIEVEQRVPGEFHVRVIEGKSETSHTVTLKTVDYDRIAAGKIEPAELVRLSFEFLLENEPKESILTRFDLSIISRYFPNFESEMKQRLASL